MTFDEWKMRNSRMFTCSHEVFVAYEAWLAAKESDEKTDFERLRELFPEIPARTRQLTITWDYDSIPEITVKFYPEDSQ